MKPQKQIYTILIGSIFLAILLAGFFIVSLFSGIKSSSEDLISQRKIFISFETKLKNLENFGDLYQQIEPNLKKIPTLFINSETPIGFITFLEEKAKDSQISINISSASPGSTKEEPWPFLVLKITTIGSFPNFLKFLDKLESSSYLIKVQNLNIAKLNEGDLSQEGSEVFSEKDVTATFSIKVFAE